MKITVKSHAKAAIEDVWDAYTSPSDIKKWNAASEDWHTPEAESDLREGGKFSYRMEARDASEGFDFEGTFTRIEKPVRLEYELGGRDVVVEFQESGGGTDISITFDTDNEMPEDAQRAGWQAILDNFTRYVDRKSGG